MWSAQVHLSTPTGSKLREPVAEVSYSPCQHIENMNKILNEKFWEEPGWIRDHFLRCFVVLGLKSAFAKKLYVIEEVPILNGLV